MPHKSQGTLQTSAQTQKPQMKLIFSQSKLALKLTMLLPVSRRQNMFDLPLRTMHRINPLTRQETPFVLRTLLGTKRCIQASITRYQWEKCSHRLCHFFSPLFAQDYMITIFLILVLIAPFPVVSLSK